MLSDEEKKAIERLNKRYEFFGENPLATNVWLTLDIHNLGIVLNLIETQQKEIEELKQDRDEYKEEYIKLQNARYYNYISKDKIKAKIEEIEKRRLQDGECELALHGFQREAKIEVLKSLIEKE